MVRYIDIYQLSTFSQSIQPIELTSSRLESSIDICRVYLSLSIFVHITEEVQVINVVFSEHFSQGLMLLHANRC